MTVESSPDQRRRMKAESLSCAKCDRSFTMTVRRHHCRACYKSFCDACSPFKIAITWGEHEKKGKVRLCVECASPRILGCSSVPTSGGEVIIRGHLFGEHDPGSVLYVRVNGEECRGVRRLAVDAAGIGNLRCSVPAGTGTENSLSVSLKTSTDDQLEGTAKFAYDPPSHLRAMSKMPTKGGWLVITGQNFGAELSCIKANCRDRDIREVELKQLHKQLRLRIPPGSGQKVALNLIERILCVWSFFVSF
jgi:hypothetical protein